MPVAINTSAGMPRTSSRPASAGWLWSTDAQDDAPCGPAPSVVDGAIEPAPA